MSHRSAAIRRHDDHDRRNPALPETSPQHDRGDTARLTADTAAVTGVCRLALAILTGHHREASASPNDRARGRARRVHRPLLRLLHARRSIAPHTARPPDRPRKSRPTRRHPAHRRPVDRPTRRRQLSTRRDHRTPLHRQLSPTRHPARHPHRSAHLLPRRTRRHPDPDSADRNLACTPSPTTLSSLRPSGDASMRQTVTTIGYGRNRRTTADTGSSPGKATPAHGSSTAPAAASRSPPDRRRRDGRGGYTRATSPAIIKTPTLTPQEVVPSHWRTGGPITLAGDSRNSADRDNPARRLQRRLDHDLAIGQLHLP
jgi:hypothetical protein